MIAKVKTAAKAMALRGWGACFRSLTILWQYILLVWSALLFNLDAVAGALGEPALDAQIKGLLGDARLIAKYTLIVTAITIPARLRTARKA